MNKRGSLSKRRIEKRDGKGKKKLKRIGKRNKWKGRIKKKRNREREKFERGKNRSKGETGYQGIKEGKNFCPDWIMEGNVRWERGVKGGNLGGSEGKELLFDMAH